eukprot:TRINITY_DN12127_c0_g1_i2.p1 TRINITY_DN12127_c0_g1~~TRINITY_DN12127_c0_g1_i2.p1  ORF type:complete len:163 (+),score=11.52 TRINITY_DN12127_c0_g1_i2:52-540(+)
MISVIFYCFFCFSTVTSRLSSPHHLLDEQMIKSPLVRTLIQEETLIEANHTKTSTVTREAGVSRPSKRETTPTESGLVIILIMFLACSLCFSVRYRAKKEIIKAIVQLEVALGTIVENKLPVDPNAKRDEISEKVGLFNKEEEIVNVSDAFNIDDSNAEKSV